MRVRRELEFCSISVEKNVLIGRNGKSRLGRYDFLANCKNKLIGFEVLTRPTQGKLREKLVYSKAVDEFVFVLPKNSMNFYLKPKGKIFHKSAKLNFLEKEFDNPKIFVWLFDLENGTFEKGKISKIFNVEK